MSSVVLSNGAVLLARPQSITCGADVELPGRVRLVDASLRTLARGKAALRAAWPHLSQDARDVLLVKPAEPPRPEVDPDWANASVEQIASSQPEILQRIGPERLAFRSAGDEVGWRSQAEKLRDAGFVSFSLNKPSAAAGDAIEDAGSALSAADLTAAPVAGTLAPDWGAEEVQRRWRLNGPIYRIGRLRSGEVSTICNAFGPVFTISFTDRDGRLREIGGLRQEQAEEAVEAIEADGGALVSSTEEDRWHRRPLGKAAQARGRVIWTERFGADWVRPKPQPRRRSRLVLPYYLRHDVVFERTMALYEDRAEVDDAPPDSPSVLEYAPHWHR